MAMAGLNTNNPAIKRIMHEAREIMEDGPNPDFAAAPQEDNVFEWHFTIRGPPSTAFEGGRYHGRITLPPDYPFKPPSIALLTPNGRFEVGKKICLSVSEHHPEDWQPAWGIRTIITALIAFFPTKAEGALAGLDYSAAERQKLAAASRSWRCSKCGVCMSEALAEPSAGAEPPPPPPPELRFTHSPAVASPHASSTPPPSGEAGEAQAEDAGEAQERADEDERQEEGKDERQQAAEEERVEERAAAACGGAARREAARAGSAAPVDRLGLLACALLVAIVALISRKLVTAEG
eukprot:CAMPEP_0205856482 /NCGR_PEP_ID=MMETSP1083-20121108/3150_1 /ASSEMBLY_ACC=CAM_ASM_000430 /TAXON_ID=97485 /ORGANISM="Prymnesium parvum, Strain Texoma1" /LENGTH=292 /DNA_ID=CAMNT_0053217903 /DNA_START=1 /DNA_END=879 /DNA_ORIENTATION=+